MSTLFRFELKKIVANKVFIISCLFLMFMSFTFLYFQYTNSYSLSNYVGTTTSDKNHATFSGRRKIDRSRKFTAYFDGMPVDNAFNEKFESMFKDSFIPDSNGNYDIDKLLIGTSVMGYIGRMQNNNVLILDVNVGVATYYIPDDFWGESGTPVFWYTEGWSMIINMLPTFQQLVLLLVITICARSVSSEYSSGMINIVLPTNYGKSKLITAKLLSALLVAIVIFIFMSSLCIMLFGTIWGFDNPQADIRVFSNGAYLHLGTSMTCVELLLSTLMVNLCSVIMTVFICMLISSIMRNSYSAVILTFAILLSPQLLQGFPISSKVFTKIIALLPTNIPSIMTKNWNTLELPLDILILIPLITLLVSSASIIGTYTLIRRHKAAK
ncbi:MAG: ABC transporter permease [Eubacteriales bacterium]